jgi:hypothetical protein
MLALYQLSGMETYPPTYPFYLGGWPRGGAEGARACAKPGRFGASDGPRDPDLFALGAHAEPTAPPKGFRMLQPEARRRSLETG